VYCDLHLSTAPQCAGFPVLMLRHFDGLYQFLQTPEFLTVLGRASPSDFTFYGTAWSIVRWLMDQYATSESTFMSQLVQSPLTGVANLEARVPGHPWEEIFGEWALALFTDDYPGVTFANPRLKFPSWNVRDEFQGMCNDLGSCSANSTSTLYPLAYPLAARPTSFGAFDTQVSFLNSGTFTSWLLSGPQLAPQLLALRGFSGGDPPAQIRVAIVRVK
jgi:hypothetical protein